jgi:hypothetical protein
MFQTANSSNVSDAQNAIAPEVIRNYGGAILSGLSAHEIRNNRKVYFGPKSFNNLNNF